MTALHFETASALAAMVRSGEIGSLELLEHFLARVDEHNPALNAIIWKDIERARSRARAADAARAAGEELGPLHGVPMTIKESFNVAGAPTTWGFPDLADNRATEDALAVRRFEAAGAVLFGKTNVPISLADWQSFNAIYGTTNNPWDLSRTPGGSSGGSAAALAAGLTALEAGSDIGASIRNPAHYCGVFGHKPTWGLCPTDGHALPGSVAPADISVIGPLARGAGDLRQALLAMAGPNRFDAAGFRRDLAAPRAGSLRELRVAVKLADPNSAVETAYCDRLQDLADKLARAGATVREAEPDLDTRRVHEVYVLLLRAATSGRMADADLERWQRTARDVAPDDTSYLARMARGNTLSHRDWLALNNERWAMRHAWADFFNDWDVLLCPAAATAAWPHDQDGERHERTIEVDGRTVPTTDQMFWAGYSGLVYLPSTVGPAGLVAPGLPVGYQLIAGHLQDLTSIGAAELIEREFGGFEPPPAYAEG